MAKKRRKSDVFANILGLSKVTGLEVEVY